MGRIRLYVAQSLRVPAEEVLDSQGTRIELPFLRVFSMLRIGQRVSDTREGILDSAAPLTLIPQCHWQHFAQDIEWLTPVRPISWLTSISGKTGGSSPCRVGRVEVTAFDLERPPRELAPVPVIALFEQQPGADDRIIVGVHASILLPEGEEPRCCAPPRSPLPPKQ
jgi:hypothetical protein